MMYASRTLVSAAVRIDALSERADVVIVLQFQDEGLAAVLGLDLQYEGGAGAECYRRLMHVCVHPWTPCYIVHLLSCAPAAHTPCTVFL